MCLLLFTYPLQSMLAVLQPSFAYVAVVGALFVSFIDAVLGSMLAELFRPKSGHAASVFPSQPAQRSSAAIWLNQVGGSLYTSFYVMLVCVITRAKPMS